ncbi:MAG: quinone-dependent dihydroorotate dehydrogenase [Propylenella sp.]
MTLADRATGVLRLIEPERAHRLAIKAARHGSFRPPAAARDPRLAIVKLGLDFPNPIGLAAGFDKNAEVPDAMLGLGFGFVEVGTLTPLPQEGNPKPRLFRLSADHALINRLGFNNEGHDAALDRLDRRVGRAGIVGVNIGANRNSEDRIFDYVAGVRLFAPEASYLTVNVSSPNTPGLRDLQAGPALGELLRALRDARKAAEEECGRPTPLLLKIAPDLDDKALAALIETAVRHGIDGLIVSNTTVVRPPLKSRRHTQELGGLSGPPLLELSTAMLSRTRQLAGKDLVLVGAGGVDSAAAAWSKIAAGADLVQVYTGLVYEGPSLPRRIVADLLKRLEERNIRHIADVRGIETERWAAAWPH